MTMPSLYAVEVLLHYHYSPEEHEGAANGSVAWRTVITFLLEEQLLSVRVPPSAYGATYETTARGKVYIEALRNLPLPVEIHRWEMPS